jgi:4-amino-4-deoxy-L-arabinose transferase-like glycosyltransferase
MALIEKMSWRRLLIVIVLLAGISRVLAALYLGNAVVALPGTHDQISYNALAQSLLAGRGFSFVENWYPFTEAGEPTAHWSFIYPLYLAGVYKLFGYQPVVARILQAAIGSVAICLLVYFIGRHLEDKRVGVVGAGLTVVYGYLVYYNAALMTETFFIVALLAAVLLTLNLGEQPTRSKLVLLGVALGSGTLLRQTMLVLIPVFLFYLLSKCRSKIKLWELLIPPGVAVLLIIPWSVRNQIVYGEFLPLNSNAGYALYAANHPQLGSSWKDVDLVVVPIPAEMEGMNEAQLNSALTAKAIGFVAADPIRYVALTLSKAIEYFKFWPSQDSSTISNLTRVVSFGLFLPLFLLGFVVSLSRWRTYLLIYLVVATHTLIHVLSWPAIRYRLPMDVLLMPLAALALVTVAKRLQEWQSTRVYT